MKDDPEIRDQLKNRDPYIWSVALSHSLTDGITTGIFDGVTDWTTEDLCERLKVNDCLWSSHPLYLLITLLDIYVGHTA